MENKLEVRGLFYINDVYLEETYYNKVSNEHTPENKYFDDWFAECKLFDGGPSLGHGLVWIATPLILPLKHEK